MSPPSETATLLDGQSLPKPTSSPTVPSPPVPDSSARLTTSAPGVPSQAGPSVRTRVTPLDLHRPRSATSRQSTVTLPGLRSRTRFSSLSSLPPIPSTPTMSWQWQGVSHSFASPNRRAPSPLISRSKPPTRFPQMISSPSALIPVMPPRPSTHRSGTTPNTTPLRRSIAPPSP